MLIARRIFNDWERSLEYATSFLATFSKADSMIAAVVLMENLLTKRNFVWFLIIGFLSVVVVGAPLSVVALCAELIYLPGPFACAAISSWRIAKLNHGKRDDGTDSMSDMMAALNMFYSLVIFQGTMFGVLVFSLFVGDSLVASHLLALEHLSEKWGKHAIRMYISDINAKCRKDSLSIKGRDMIKYAAELLDSESQEDYLYGARLLSAFIKKGEDVRWLLLPSTHRHRIQRLIDSLMISSSSNQDEACVQFRYRRDRCFAVIGSLDDKMEIRELAATIVADVAAHIDDLYNYPGAMRCISSLLQDQEETTQTYQNQKHYHQAGHMQILLRTEKEWRHMDLMRHQKRTAIREHAHGHRNKRQEGSTSNKLVQQGLTILQRLASNSGVNRRIICRAPGLLPKITAPLYSETLIQDIKTKAWADIVTRCLKVLYQLIHAPGRPSSRLRHQIFSKHQVLNNLKSILELGNEADHQELQLVAIKILTELALDLSMNLNDQIKEVLVAKQLHLFLLANGDDDEESAAMAGRAMVSLSTNSESNNSALIMTTQDDIICRLAGILDDENITRRTIAAEIMTNLCAHCSRDHDDLVCSLPKVLRKIMSIKTKSQQRNILEDQNNLASGDEENQENSVSRNDEETHSISTDGDDTEIQEISDQEREEQEAFLSLAQVICDKLVSADSADLDVSADSADSDDAVMSAVNQNNAGSDVQRRSADSTNLDDAILRAVDENNAGTDEQRREAFVDKLKTIIDGNCHPTADSLRIVKLCGRIAKSVMMGCEQYVENFRNKGFKSSLSEASKTMSELESCMRFVGTDFGPKKTVRPLLEDLARDVANKL